MTEMKYQNIPEELKKVKSWVCWKKVPDEKRPGGFKKVPINPINGYGAKSNDSSTWTDFPTACNMMKKRGLDGLGFMFGGTGYVGVDIDHCVEDKKLSAFAQEVVEFLKSYTEYSPSGNGIHIICKGKMPTGGNRNTEKGLEMYATGRFFTMTGEVLTGYEKLYPCPNEIEILHSKYIKKKEEPKAIQVNRQKQAAPVSDTDLLEKAKRGKNGTLFDQLYNGSWQGHYKSQSDADLAFCNMLAFWFGCDFDRMDRVFRSSGLMRPKWDEMHGLNTYGNMTLTKAVDSCENVYEPPKDKINRITKEIKEGTKKEPDKFDFERDERSGKIQMKYLDFEEFARYLIEKYNIVKIDQVLHRYSDGLYVYLSGDEFDGIVLEEVFNSKINNRKEFHKYVKYYSKAKESSHYRYILFQNGVYDLEERKLLPVSPDFVFCNRIPHNYNVNASRYEVVDKFLSDLVCDNAECVKLLWQMIGYTFCRKNFTQEFFFILGAGCNGKSTFLNFMKFLIGADNTSYLTIEDMKENFNLPLLKNKLLNIGDDIENEYVEKVGALKKAVTGEAILAGGKYKDKEPMKFYGKLLFSGNSIPPMNDKTNGMKRRINVLPFLNNFSDNPDVNISERLEKEEVAEYAIKVGIDYLIDLLNAKEFVKPDIVKEATEDYNRKNNPVIEFIEEYPKTIKEKVTTIVYMEYQNFCKDCGYRPLGRNGFYEAMKGQGYERIQNDSLPDRPRMFKKLRENKQS